MGRGVIYPENLRFELKNILYEYKGETETKGRQNRRRKNAYYKYFENMVKRNKSIMTDFSIVHMLVEVYNSMDMGSFHYEHIANSARKSLRLLILDNFKDVVITEEL